MHQIRESFIHLIKIFPRHAYLDKCHALQYISILPQTPWFSVCGADSLAEQEDRPSNGRDILNVG